jgi:hypothetical protein
MLVGLAIVGQALVAAMFFVDAFVERALGYLVLMIWERYSLIA